MTDDHTIDGCHRALRLATTDREREYWARALDRAQQQWHHSHATHDRDARRGT